MSSYVWFNIVFSIFAAITSMASARTRSDLLRYMRVGLIITLIGYPWDFLAISLGVWVYPQDPGMRLYGVPLNDLWFMFAASLFAASFLDRTVLARKSR